MIICAGILTWLFEEYSRIACSASCAKSSARARGSVASFSRRVPEVSERISQNCSGDSGAAMLNCSTRSLTSFARPPQTSARRRFAEAKSPRSVRIGGSTQISLHYVGNCVRKRFQFAFAPHDEDTMPSCFVLAHLSQGGHRIGKNIASNLQTTASTIRFRWQRVCRAVPKRNVL